MIQFNDIMDVLVDTTLILIILYMANSFIFG